ncbi:MAG: trypsin-like peptidase domain-containing protein [Candidatus Glassbacteria bacterium]
MKSTFSKLLLFAAILVFGLIYFLNHERPKPQTRSGEASDTQQSQAITAEKVTQGESLLWAQASRVDPSSGASRLDSLEADITASRRNSIVRAAEKVAPTVVSVNVLQTQVVQTPVRDFFGYFYIPRSRTVQNLGSGFIINSRGYILTNDHVVHGASKITVSTSTGINYDAVIVGLDASSDVAVLKINPGADKLPASQLGDSDDLYIGEWVIAIGSPFGLLLDDPQPTVTVGVISAVGRDMVRDQESGGKVYANMIQTDAAINPGNSGGPLVNALGEVIGINTFIFSPSGGSIGMGFAIPINRAVRIAEELIRGGKVRHPWLGISVQDVTADLLTGLGFGRGEHPHGVLVSGVQELSPAARTGRIRPGDLITGINGKPLRSQDDWTGEMIDVRVGNNVQLTVKRPAAGFEVSIVPLELPTEILPRLDTGLGFSLIDLTAEVRSQLEARSTYGAVMEEITDSDLEQEGSLLRYDILYRINDTRVSSASQAVDLLKRLSRQSVTVLFLERGGRSIRRYLTR